eukprot:COSAG05_NODE_276_length_12393_cov_1737.505694_17_plen_55_part_00
MSVSLELWIVGQLNNGLWHMRRSTMWWSARGRRYSTHIPLPISLLMPLTHLRGI